MVRRINKFLAVILVVALACFLFHYNRQNIRVSFGPSTTIEAPLAIILLSVFFLGGSVVGVFSVLIGARNSFSAWLAERQRRRNRSHGEMLLRGREHLAIRSFAEARAQFSKIVQQDPNNTLAWQLLADTLLQEGDPRAALGALNEARLLNRESVELLARTAALEEQFGNTTSAYDNYVLVLAQYPGNIYTLRRAVDCCVKLERFEDAGRYLQELARRLTGIERDNALSQLAQCELSQARQQSGSDPVELRAALEAVLRRHRNFAPAMVELAFLERENGQLEQATKLLTQAFRQDQRIEHLEPLATMWLAVNDPARAVAAVRTAVNSSGSIEGALFLISLFLYLEMLDDASAELARIEKNATLSRAHRTQLQLLKAHLLARQGRADQVSSTLLGLIDDERAVPALEPYFLHHRKSHGTSKEYWTEQFKLKRSALAEPSPQLSTP